MNSVYRLTATLLVLAIGIVVAPVASAELQRVEAVGNYGIHEATRTRVIARDEAIAMARWAGVSRVALELIAEAPPTEMEPTDGDGTGEDRRGEGTPPSTKPREPGSTGASDDASEGPSEDQLTALRAALGKDVLPYMRSYRILDDRGEVPVFIKDDPDVTVEYVVVVEVLVDVGRVVGALERAGLIAGADSAEAGDAISVELIGLSRYEAFDYLLVALREQFGATRVQTVEFSRERQVLLVEGPFGPSALSAKLARLESPQLILEPIGVDAEGRRIRLMGHWFPAYEESEAGASPEES